MITETLEFEKMYTLQELAGILRMHPESLRRLNRQGKIKGIVKIGRQYLLSQSHVDDLLAEGTEFKQPA